MHLFVSFSYTGLETVGATRQYCTGMSSGVLFNTKPPATLLEYDDLVVAVNNYAKDNVMAEVSTTIITWHVLSD